MAPWLSKEKGTHISRSDLLSAGKFMRPEDMLHLARVRHIGSMFLAAPPLLHAMVKRDNLAVGGYHASLHWFWGSLGRDVGLPRPHDWVAWRDFLVRHPTTWKSTVKRAGLRYARGYQRLAEVDIWHRRIYQTLKDIGSILADTRAAETVHACLVCEKGFVNMRAWFCHASQRHGYQGRICPCCNKNTKAL